MEALLNFCRRFREGVELGHDAVVAQLHERLDQLLGRLVALFAPLREVAVLLERHRHRHEQGPTEEGGVLAHRHRQEPQKLVDDPRGRPPRVLHDVEQRPKVFDRDVFDVREALVIIVVLVARAKVPTIVIVEL